MDLFTETALKNFCSSHGYFGGSSVFVRFEKAPVSDKTEKNGYNSDMLFGQIVYRTQQNEEKISAPLVLKVMPSEHLCSDYIFVQYFNEIFYYTRIQPIFHKLSSLEALVPKFYDSYVRSSDQKSEIVIIIENLKAQGYVNHQKYSFLDLDHLTLMLRKIGQFHSYSYFMKSQNPKEFQTFANWFQYPDRELIYSVPNYFRLHSEVGVQRLRQDPRYNSRMQKVEEVFKKAEDFMIEVNTAKPEDPMAVLVHGDFLRGNVMFKYENEKLVDLRLIDMATCRVASPVIDLSVILYLNADQKTRDQHWNQLIDAYHEGLCDKFGGIGVPTKENILKEFVDKAIHGYFIASHFLQVSIELDRGNFVCHLEDLMPAEYSTSPMGQIPEHVLKDTIKRMFNEETTEAMADILRDIIDRNFI